MNGSIIPHIQSRLGMDASDAYSPTPVKTVNKESEAPNDRVSTGSVKTSIGKPTPTTQQHLIQLKMKAKEVAKNDEYTPSKLMNGCTIADVHTRSSIPRADAYSPTPINRSVRKLPPPTPSKLVSRDHPRGPKARSRKNNGKEEEYSPSVLMNGTSIINPKLPNLALEAYSSTPMNTASLKRATSSYATPTQSEKPEHAEKTETHQQPSKASQDKEKVAEINKATSEPIKWVTTVIGNTSMRLPEQPVSGPYIPPPKEDEMERNSPPKKVYRRNNAVVPLPDDHKDPRPINSLYQQRRNLNTANRDSKATISTPRRHSEIHHAPISMPFKRATAGRPIATSKNVKNVQIQRKISEEEEYVPSRINRGPMMIECPARSDVSVEGYVPTKKNSDALSVSMDDLEDEPYSPSKLMDGKSIDEVDWAARNKLNKASKTTSTVKAAVQRKVTTKKESQETAKPPFRIPKLGNKAQKK
uniref:Shugoshin_C domain-containing protein n=1 Tax=Caenorhabditis tropicalis TaxID=1561998 RepID=A0A1I7U7L2_9PELO